MLVDVQSKLRLALGSVKDHASIGKAMIYNYDGYSGIEIAVVRATSHDNTPIDDKYMHEILFLVSNSPGSIPFLAERISHRLNKTRNRVVALKTLVLVHRLLRGGDRYFEQDLRHAYLSSHLQMNNTRWFSSRNFIGRSICFLYSYVAFLEERMGWAINQAGKLEPIMLQGGLEFRFYEEKSFEIVFRRLPKCQVFLDRVLGFSPSEISTSDRLTQAAMSNILRESFQVYATFCEGVATLLDSFFDFKDPARVLALDLLKRASRQTYALSDFFTNCKRSIIGSKNLDYPIVQIITTDHVLTMEQFLSCSPMTASRHGPLFTKIKSFPCPNSKEEARKEQTLFSCRLETKISKVWVVFDEEDQEEEPKTSHFSVARLDDHFMSIANDHSLARGNGEIL